MSDNMIGLDMSNDDDDEYTINLAGEGLEATPKPNKERRYIMTVGPYSIVAEDGIAAIQWVEKDNTIEIAYKGGQILSYKSVMLNLYSLREALLTLKCLKNP